MLKLAILTPVHGHNGVRIIWQLQNYLKWCKGLQIRFYIHPSLESTNQLTADVLGFATRDSVDIAWCPISTPTSFKTCLNAILSMDTMLAKDDYSPDYVYYHSDSDLLFCDGVGSEIAKYDLGVEIEEYTAEINAAWPHASVMWVDPRFSTFLSEFLKGDKSMIRMGRTEGSFYKKRVWDQLITVVRRYFGDAFFETAKNHWCAEEILIPTIANCLAANTIFPSWRQNLIFTKHPGRQLERNSVEGKITVSDIQELRRQGVFFGAKWFSNDPEDPARRLLL